MESEKHSLERYAHPKVITRLFCVS